MDEGLEMATVYKLGGKTVTAKEWEGCVRRKRNKHRSAGTAICSGQASTGRGGWPLMSSALGCHPSQVKEMYDHSVEIGVPTHFDSQTGKCKLLSRAHRRDYMKANGVHDNDGGIGDG